MKEFIAMWRNYANFSGVTSRRGYWMAILVGAVITAAIDGIAEFTGSPFLNFISIAYALAGLIPSLAIVVRRYRDAGKSWTNLFWLLVPVIGWVICIYLLIKRPVNSDVDYV